MIWSVTADIYLPFSWCTFTDTGECDEIYLIDLTFHTLQIWAV